MGTRFHRCTLRIDSAETTPSGGLRIPAHIARTGVQTYRTDSGVRIEYRPPEEVFSEDALASFRGATVTVRHPTAQSVSPDNWRRVAVGHIGDDIRQDGDLVAATVFVEDADTIERIKSKELIELSAGYTTTVQFSEGTTDKGERYDAIQTEIRGNHVALLPPGTGRAGPEVRLRIDAQDNEIPRETREDSMSVTKDELRAELDKLRADMQESQVAMESQRRDREELQGRCDALQAENAELKEQLAKAASPEAIQSRVDARQALVERAKVIDPKAEPYGSDREIMVAVLGDRVTSDASDDYVRGAFEALYAARSEDAQTRRQTTDAITSVIVPPRNDGQSNASRLDEIEAENYKRLRSAWKGASK